MNLEALHIKLLHFKASYFVGFVSERNSSNKKCLVMKQFLSADQLDEIEEIIEMKITHRKNIDRRRDKFGYESVSTMGIAVAGADVIQVK